MVELGSIVGGKYRLEHQIGVGGMATIWRAVHMELHRPVAVKFLSIAQRDRAPEEVRERFLHEARLAASVRHRNVVDIIDFGTTENGGPYMVMELLEGQLLADRMVDGPALSVADYVRIISASLTGLQAVHDAGIVHQDLKPENVFLVRDSDSTVYPKLLDFGISKATRPLPSGRASLPPVEGLIVGTPHYMSPEQARGAKDVDHRTDIYSMAVMLYEGLAGQLPFEAEDPREILKMVVGQDPVPLATLRPELGEDISNVIRVAMSRTREERFDSALAMRDALLRAAEGAGLLGPGWGTATARMRAVQSLEVETVGIESAAPPTRSRAGLWLGLVALAAGTAMGIGLLTHNGDASGSPGEIAASPAAAPAPGMDGTGDTVQVRLHNVPAEGGVRVDGAPIAGYEATLERDDRPHLIEVTAGGEAIWSTRFVASRDADYDVPPPAPAAEAASEPAPPARRPHRRRPRVRAAVVAADMAVEGTAAPADPTRMQGGQFHDPGF